MPRDVRNIVRGSKYHTWSTQANYDTLYALHREAMVHDWTFGLGKIASIKCPQNTTRVQQSLKATYRRFSPEEMEVMFGFLFRM